MATQTTPARPAELRRSLGVAGGWAVAASSTAATTSIGIGMGSLAALVGAHLPIVLILGFLPILGIAVAYARLNRVQPNCGNGYVWVGRSLGPWLGFLAGWVILVGTLIFLAYTTAICGSLLLQLAARAGLPTPDPGSTVASTVVGLVVLAAVAVAAVTGIAKAARFQVALLVFEYATLLGFCGWGIARGSQPFSWSWFDPFDVPSAGALAQGLTIAIFIYWGWDSAFSVTEETRTAGTSARSGYLTLVASLGVFVLGAVAFQRVLAPQRLVEHPADGLAYYAATLAAEPLASLPLVALLCSVIASLLSGLIPTVRQAFAMGRDGTLGPLWTRVHPRYGTPAAGTVACVLIAVVIAALAAAIPRLGEMVLAAVNAIGVLISFYYGLTALACAVRFRALLREAPARAIGAVVVPACSGLAVLAIGTLLVHGYLTMSDRFAVRADNGYFLLACPLAVLACGLGAAAWARWRRRPAYFRTGEGSELDAR